MKEAVRVRREREWMRETEKVSQGERVDERSREVRRARKLMEEAERVRRGERVDGCGGAGGRDGMGETGGRDEMGETGGKMLGGMR